MAATKVDKQRRSSYGQDADLTLVDRAGVWLSDRRIRGIGPVDGKRVADIGCGYHASFAMRLQPVASAVTLLDVALNPDLAEVPKVRCVVGSLPDALAELESESVDLLVCNSVLEHLWDPLRSLGEFWRILAPGGVSFINVPSWMGKRFLEFSAFRLGLSPAVEMNDHKNYYDPRDLWPLLVRAGFAPRDIACHRHKLGLNTYAVCRKDPASIK